MKPLILLAGLSALVPISPLATTPHMSGSYLMAVNTFCPAVLSSAGYLGVPQAGWIFQEIGVATLTPNKSNKATGTFAFSGVDNDGPVVTLGSGFTTSSDNSSGAYSFSGTTFVFTIAGQPAQTYTAYPGLVNSSGVIQDLLAQRLDSNGCSAQLIFRLK